MRGTLRETRTAPTRPTPHPSDPDDVLAPRRLTAYVLARSEDTVKRHCAPVACDVRTRALLYSAKMCTLSLASRRASPGA